MPALPGRAVLPGQTAAPTDLSMSQVAPQTPTLPHLGISTALLASEVPALTADGKPPEWIKVTPRGKAQTRDGRSYTFDPEALVSRFKSDGVDVPVDLNHETALKASKGERVYAVGYVKTLEARADGTYARVNWIDSDAAGQAVRSHRYVSPTFPHDADGNATWLHSISLVAAPALPNMPALAAALPGAAPPRTIAEALGLGAGADEAACLSAIGTLRASFVPIGLFNDAVAALNVAKATLAARDTEGHQAKVKTLMEDALKSMRILPYQREGYEALCQTEAGFQHVATLFAGMQPLAIASASGLDGRHAPDGRGTNERPEELAGRAARYRESETNAGRRITQSEATRYVQANPQAGR